MKKSSAEETVDLFFNICKNVLRFFNLTDRSNNLSITNIALIVCVTKIALIPEPSVVDLGALFVSILSYMHKRTESNKAAKEAKAVATFKDMEDKISELNKKVEDLSTTQDTVAKQAEQIQKLVSTANVFQALQPRK